MNKLLKLALASLLALLAGTSLADRPQVVTSIHPYYDLVRQIGGDLVDAVRLLPVGVSPHSFDPTPRDLMRVSDADLLIRNGGLGLDEWADVLADSSGTSAQRLVIMDELEFEPLGHGEFVNSHIWLDVTIAMSAAEAISDALVEIDPGNENAYRANTEVLLQNLEELDAWLLETLAPVQGAAFVPFHDAWPYFARRYGLELVVEIEPYPGREPTPDYLVMALDLIRDSGARAIFGERQLGLRPAEVVAAEAGLPIYVLDPEGGGANDLESYQDLLRFNAGVLLEGLSQ